MKTSPSGRKTTTKIARNGTLRRGCLVREPSQVKPSHSLHQLRRAESGQEGMKGEKGEQKAHKWQSQQPQDEAKGRKRVAGFIQMLGQKWLEEKTSLSLSAGQGHKKQP